MNAGIAARDRSYLNRLEGGERVRFTEDHYHGRQIHAGETGTVAGADTNAGFRGIVGAVRLDADEHFCWDISTGILEVLS